MKRTFLTKRNALLSSADLSWGAFALAFALLILFMRLLAPNLFWRVFTPIFHSADSVAAESHAFFSIFGDKAALTLRNEQLVNENTALASENQALLQKEESLGALLGSPAPKQESAGIIAGVIARPPASPYDTLTLSLGANAGVTLGQEAFAEGNVPLGVVSSVLADFSRVTLFSAPGMVVQGWIGHATVPLSIQGSGGGAMHASLARSVGVVAGDTVLAPGPGALSIGTVVRVDGDPSSPVVTLQIRPALNLFSVTWVALRDTGAAFTNSLSWATSTLP